MVTRTTEDTDRKFQKELNAGIASLVLLSVLNRASEPMYGYRIAKIIEKGGDDLPIIKQGTLYPVLRSLEGGGLLDSTVEPSVSGPPRRYYSITPAGVEALRRWTDMWRKTQEFTDMHLKGDYGDE